MTDEQVPRAILIRTSSGPSNFKVAQCKTRTWIWMRWSYKKS